MPLHGQAGDPEVLRLEGFELAMLSKAERRDWCQCALNSQDIGDCKIAEWAVAEPNLRDPKRTSWFRNVVYREAEGRGTAGPALFHVKHPPKK